MRFTRKLTASLKDLDAARLQSRYRGLDVTPLGELTLRCPVRVAGEIQRTRVAPLAGIPSLEITVADGTGGVVAVFTGRRRIGGVEVGRGIMLEGVAHASRGRRVILNPAYTLLPG